MGDGAMQVQTDEQMVKFEELEEIFQSEKRSYNEDDKLFFKLFTESTREGSRAAAREMHKNASRQTKCDQSMLLFHSINPLKRTDSEKLRWPNSPLRIMLRFEFTTGPSTLRNCPSGGP